MTRSRLPKNIIEAVTGSEWWGPWFKKAATWRAWFVFLKALFALGLDDEELAIWRKCTGRETAPKKPAREAWAVCGRRAGKTRVMATVAAWLAAFGNWRKHLAPGEKATVMLVAADRKQGRTAFRYLRSLFRDHPGLATLVENETLEALELGNQVVIEIATASFRTTRGYSLAAVLADELAFWRSEETGANPADEILAALRPALMPGGLLLVASSPHARRGPLWDTYRRHYAQDADPIVVWKAPTRVMNATIPQSVIDEAYAEDATRAAAEYGAEFRSDLEFFVAREVVEAAVVLGRHEMPRVAGARYCGFCDPSGGSRDAMTLAIGHKERDKAVLDVVRERQPPFSPEAVVAEFAGTLKAYGIAKVHGDRYAGEWPVERFHAHGIEYLPAEQPKSDIYRDALPLLNSGNVELLDNRRLVAQLCGLERRTARGGRDSIDHAPGGRDDLCNAACGALLLAFGRAPAVIGKLITDSILARASRPGSFGRRCMPLW
jgi:hypothetical protein